jgi:hypothetical protein
VIKKEIHQRTGESIRCGGAVGRRGGGHTAATVKAFMPHDESLLESRRIL